MKAWKKALIGGVGVGIGVAGVFVTQHIITKKLADLAIVRATPEQMAKGKSRVSGTKNTDAVRERMSNAAKLLEAREHSVVEITSFDGIRLVGHYFKAKAPKRIVIAMHGWRSAWNYDYSLLSNFFEKSGCSVLYPEQRGQNASGGDYMGFGILERHDCLEWVKYIAENESKDIPIYLFGVSMGAATVMMTSNLELPSNVVGIIADCGYTSPKDIWRHVVQNNLRVPYGFISGKVDKTYKKYTSRECNYSCTDALSETKIPVMFIHGTDDKFVPVEMTYRNYMACASKKELLIVPGAGHGRSYAVDTERYEKRVREFFKKNDKI